MESDAEYKALATIIKNDRRQRLFIRLLALVAFVVVLGFLQYLDNHIKSQVKTVLDQQTQLVLNSQKDGRVRSEENRRYITCLLILPQDKRDVQSQKFCYDKSDLPGGRTEAEFVPIEFDPNDEAIAMLQAESPVTGTANSSSVSSAQSAPAQPVTQSNTSQTTMRPAANTQPSTSNPQPAAPIPTNNQTLTIPVVTPLINALKGGL